MVFAGETPKRQMVATAVQNLENVDPSLPVPPLYQSTCLALLQEPMEIPSNSQSIASPKKIQPIQSNCLFLALSRFSETTQSKPTASQASCSIIQDESESFI